MDDKSKNQIKGAKFVPSSMARGTLKWFIEKNKKYGAEWWIMIVGFIIILLMVYLALFPGTIAPFDPNNAAFEFYEPLEVLEDMSNNLEKMSGELVEIDYNVETIGDDTLSISRSLTKMITNIDEMIDSLLEITDDKHKSLLDEKTDKLADKLYELSGLVFYPEQILEKLNKTFKEINKIIEEITEIVIKLGNPTLKKDAPQLLPPNARYIMGTDKLQRDVFSRVVHGSKTILGVALAAALLSSLIGIPLGLLSGFVGGVLDRILSLIMDSLYSFPGLILAIAFAAMLGPGIINITLAVAVIYIPTYFRLVRGQTLTIKEEVYVEAAKSIGAKRFTILFKYIFPNVIATVVVIFSLNVADAIMTEAALSYIGLGLPAGIPDWGMDLAMGKNELASGVWWLITYPGMMIVLIALGFTMLGEGLAEILNPRLLEK